MKYYRKPSGVFIELPDTTPVGSHLVEVTQAEYQNRPVSGKEEASRIVQNYLDSRARERGYDNIRSAALRSAYAGPFHDEGLAYAQWMDNCWAKCYQILGAVQAGTRAIPTESELLAELPALVLP